jgi:hypothetical protein
MLSDEPVMSSKVARSLLGLVRTTSTGEEIRPIQENSFASKLTPSAPAIWEPSIPGVFVIWIRDPSGSAWAVWLVASRLPAPGSLRTVTRAPRHSSRYGAIVRV